jgi:uncharacterized membrane protein YbhN (UPF0104 family)
MTGRRSSPAAEPEDAPAAAPFLHRVASSTADLASLRPQRRVLRWSLYAGLAVVVAGSIAIVVVSQLDQVPDVDLRLAPGWLAAGVVGFGLLQLWHAEIWRVVLHQLGFPIARARGISIWNATVLARYVPSSLLTPIMRAALAEPAGVPRRVCLVSTIYELALAFVAALALSVYFMIRIPALEGHPLRYALIAVPAVGFATLHPRVFHRVTDAALRRFGREPLPLALSVRQIVTTCALYLASFLLAGSSVLCIVLALQPVQGSDVPFILAAHAVGFSASVLAFVLPGGLGAREVAISAVLALVIPVSVAVAVAVAVRLAQLALEVLFAMLAGVVMRRLAPAA